MQKYKKSLALVVCVCFVLMTLFSLAFVSEHGCHECIGEQCEICACISHITNTFRQLRAATMAFAALFVPALLAAFGQVQCAKALSGFATPISLKVQLNN